MHDDSKPSATERARRIWWSDAARQARTMMAERGVPAGGWVDDIAARKRGVSVPDQVGRLADTMRGAGIPESEIARTIVGWIGRMVTDKPAA